MTKYINIYIIYINIYIYIYTRNTAFLTGQSDHAVRLCSFGGGAIFETRRLQQNAVTGLWGGDF